MYESKFKLVDTSTLLSDNAKFKKGRTYTKTAMTEGIIRSENILNM